MSWFEKLHETFIATGHYKLILGGFRNTIIITLGALLAFQFKNNLEVDGLCGPKTGAALLK